MAVPDRAARTSTVSPVLRRPVDPARAVCSTLALFVLVGGDAVSREGEAARAFLSSNYDLSRSDFERLDRGEVVSRTIDASDSREVATLGIVRLEVPPAFYVHRLGDIESFKNDEAVLQIGTFGRPPSRNDVDRLTLDDHDLHSLRDCAVGDCDVQLSAEAIERFRREVNWKAPGAAEQANRTMRTILVEYVTGYLAAGGPASMRYADREEPVSLEHEFVSLTESDLGGWRHFPRLRRHLLFYPAPGAPATRDLLYWSKEKVGRKTVVSVTHLAIAERPDDAPAEYAIASKHIYGSHYFDASLGLTVLLSDRKAQVPATYVAYVNRSRVDVFGGLFGPVKRKIVCSRARGLVSDQLARVQESLEKAFGARETR